MTWRDPILPVDPLTGRPLPEPVEVDRGPDLPIGEVWCPYAADMRCPTDPPCPTLRDRACVNGEDD